MPESESPTSIPPTKIYRKLRPSASLSSSSSVWPQVRGYEILSVVGAGGMGIVYKARHVELRRVVALKSIRASAAADLEFLERFYAEAEIVARLQHPNIIQIFEVGTAEPQPGEPARVPFIALEFVDGGSLVSRTGKPQSSQYAAMIVEKLARATHAAHQLGVIHRDLKPANVLLTSDGEPKIADFGLAKQVGGDNDRQSLTQAGIVMGTPEYMSPEQALGKSATPSADIYALGVILYELLTARLPFRAASVLETMELVRSATPIPPRLLQSGLPRDLDTICLKCLEKDPGRRYASAAALADDLRRFLEHRPIEARRISRTEKVTRWCKRNPLPAMLLAAVVAIFLVAFTLVSLSYYRAQQAWREEAYQRDEAQRREKAERWERYRADLVASANALQVHNIGSARATLDAAPEEHRNWEWGHFYSRLDQSQHVLYVLTPDAEVYSAISNNRRRVATNVGVHIRVWDTVERREIMAFDSPIPIAHVRISGDGRTLAYRVSTHDVALHDVDTNRVRFVLRGHQKTIHHILFSRNGERLITGSDEGHRIWDPRSGELIREIPAEQGRRHGHDFNSDCTLMTSTIPNEGVVEVIDVETGRELARMPGHHTAESHAKFNERASLVLTVEGYKSNVMRLWNAATGERICEMKEHTNSVVHTAFSPVGSRIASGSRDKTIGLWDGVSSRPIAVLRGHRGTVLHCAFSPDGKRLVTSSEDHTLRIWDAITGKPLAVLSGHLAAVSWAVFTPDNRTIISQSFDGTIRIWDVQAAEYGGVLREHSLFVYGVAVHPNGEVVASASWDGTARLWNMATGQQLARLNHGDSTVVGSVAFHPDGTMLATRARDAVRLWDSSGNLIHRWDVAGDDWRDGRVAFDRGGTRLAAACVNFEIRIWDVATRNEIGVLRGHEDGVRDVAFSPDGRWLASMGDRADRIVRIWDLNRMEQAYTLAGHTGGGYAVAFNHDGTVLASGATDGTVRLWDTATWREIAVLQLGANVYGVAFIPDGTRLACACADNSIRIWDVVRHQEVADLRGHEDYVHQVAFTPDGTQLVSASGDRTVRIWDALRLQDRKKRRSLTTE